MDAGQALVAHLYREMRIDDEWAVKEDRRFTWWSGPLAQTIWAEEPFEDLDVEICRVHARTHVLMNVPDTEKTRALIAATSSFSTMSGPLLLEDKLYSAASVVVHDGTLEMWNHIFTIASLVQVASAQIEADLMAKMTESSVARTPHPDSGFREELDDMLNIISDVIAPLGQETSKFVGEDFETAEQAVGPQISVLTTAGPDGLTSEFPFGTATSMFRMQTDQPNPRMGNGLLSVLTLPTRFAESEIPTTIVDLNRRYFTEFNKSQCVGSWCQHPSLKGSISFVSFLPNVCALPGLATTLLMYAASQSQWAEEALSERDPQEARNAGTSETSTRGDVPMSESKTKQPPESAAHEGSPVMTYQVGGKDFRTPIDGPNDLTLGMILWFYRQLLSDHELVSGNTSLRRDAEIIDNFLGESGPELSASAEERLKRAWGYYLMNESPSDAKMAANNAELGKALRDNGFTVTERDRPPEAVLRAFDRMFAADLDESSVSKDEARRKTAAASGEKDFLLLGQVFIEHLRDSAKQPDAMRIIKQNWSKVEEWLDCKGRPLNRADFTTIRRAWGAYHLKRTGDVFGRSSFVFQKEKHPLQDDVHRAFDSLKQAIRDAGQVTEADYPPDPIPVIFDNQILVAPKVYVDWVKRELGPLPPLTSPPDPLASTISALMDTRPAPKGRRSRGFRQFVFGTGCWSAAVLLYTILFEPYGSRMSDDDMLHMLSIAFLVPAAIGAAVHIYKKYVE